MLTTPASASQICKSWFGAMAVVAAEPLRAAPFSSYARAVMVTVNQVKDSYCLVKTSRKSKT
jgi:hypothetical protein